MTEVMLDEVQVLRVVLRTRREHPTLSSANLVAYFLFSYAYHPENLPKDNQ
jgi:hypothetical protein